MSLPNVYKLLTTKNPLVKSIFEEETVGEENPPPTGDFFLLLDGTNFKLLDNTNFLLLGI